ncbi:DUF2147 domain-containing protein [Oceanihabitans sediminis]|uniref:DUF2147 domain-containing protein n=1 Tax=Oceanihabitans sediminis TaxID=1812012 RepID=A0A368P6U2_9FLAO|nr:DUF2147 domain-containing protein [Oceanihabitans sediminis]MDX1278904.1 DUF2147 domain-containing protein [Oceanihabitans sediminis]MDX1774530.1 DUF2147 domain-containing protein [Oceanihabitans sediminis]RBP29073.1 uncharacterized protein (DUF2147 family) [Oceanihabitans sediminis]RCU57001.1 DUF2147 domain-containing protein [Oceanihabitans sediminis]
MNKYILFTICFCMTFSVFSQDIFGKWKTIDDETGEAKSIVSIYEKDGKVYGKIEALLKNKNKDALCTKCEGDEKNTPLVGLEFIKNLKKDGDTYKGGTIFDPESGKKYKCTVALNEDDPNTLDVRGYIAFFYKTQNWIRVKN